MNSNLGIPSLVTELLKAGHLLWEKNLVTGYNGNLSCRLSHESICITGTQTALGRLDVSDLSYLSSEGHLQKGVAPSSERGLHLAIYQAFPDVTCVVHTHTAYINGYFMERAIFEPETFEAGLYLGVVTGLLQTGPNVVDFVPVIAALRKSPIVALRRHGVVAIGESFFAAIARIQYLEEAIKTMLISRQFRFE